MIRLFAIDVDGVLTDGRIYYGSDGEALKAFHAHDGLGLTLLMQSGVEVAVISGRDSAPLRSRLDDLGIGLRRLGERDKGAALRALMAARGLERGEVAFMGDDLPDLPALDIAGLSFAPANAVDAVRAAADIVVAPDGGDGAVRAACDEILARAGVPVQTLIKRAAKKQVSG